MNNKSIGFFDSGVGGLSVYSRFRELLPNENTIYFGDLANLPYGNKSKDELIKLGGRILDFFTKKDVKAVVIACNTSSALAYETLKNSYDFKIYPIIQSCAEVISQYNIKNLGVFATAGTVSSKAYTNEIHKYNKYIEVKEIACPNWVSIVEKSNNIILKSDIETTEEFLDIKNRFEEMMKFNPDKVILGCTHYPYLLPILTKFAPLDLFIDPAKMFAKFIKNDLTQKGLLSTQVNSIEEFYVSANPELFIQNSKLFCELKSLPQVV